MADALIGYTGFVGSTLLRQTRFDGLYRSTTIGDIDGRGYDMLVCAGAPAQKWIANREPEADLQQIEGLIGHLRSVQAGTVVLVSTVDVFPRPIGVDERTEVVEEGLHAYGLHRRWLEKFVQQHFERHLIVRLPGLVGPGLRKNVIFDFLNDNNVQAIDSRSVFQFYPMVNLWADIQLALSAGLQLVHLTAEPVSVSDIAALGFGRPFVNTPAAAPATYDMRSVHAGVFGGAGAYQYSAREALLAVRAYAQSEAPTLKPAGAST